MALVIRRSGIHAKGCFTTTRIRKGARIIEYRGRRLSPREADKLPPGGEVTYLFGLSDGSVIDGQGKAARINHSCAPNCETVEEDGRVWIVARRDIRAGEELSYDYMLYDGDGKAPCSCGAPRCRGTMYAPKRRRRARRRKKPSR
jgi:SET domain-containing protein